MPMLYNLSDIEVLYIVTTLEAPILSIFADFFRQLLTPGTNLRVLLDVQA